MLPTFALEPLSSVDIMVYSPTVSSTEFDLSNLVDLLDELIESMFAKVALTTGKDVSELRSDVENLELQTRSPRRRRRHRKR